MKNSFLSKLSLFITLSATLFISSCDTGGYEPPEEDSSGKLSPTEAVAPDGVLETVTWNLEWYGAPKQGPEDDFQQAKNVLQVVDSLNADLYALQEISSQQAIDELTQFMPGYRGFVAEYVPYNQKMAFIYNTNTIDSLSAGPITEVRDTYQEEWGYYWASGREPLYFEFQFTTADGNEGTYYAISIHGKANTSDYQESYQRRQKAAEGLYHYLQDEKPDANIILLGDYNDDVDQSIYYEEQNDERVYQETPYDEFVTDTENFSVITKKLSDNGISASVNYDNIIDHITMSNELFDNYIEGSVGVYEEAQGLISNYGETTSDHLPVWVQFDVAK
ncbi:endonuclease/exonuclease/phosphatase family protein [Fodinibius salsisoli]|uniref:Endonuclease/exonuclease/phosphatase family protein n=1 Tax=Fodinibius salsisoli TaxID=2820877 RepID=A0ABT3PR75_9BACT|nr:endonuclease/exonuclease/phosphatase family protein [Fodinibius salsisoli]MCW9708362.1 endonuclease/exonuclease/phosphatase family protein [Fodinibius salsisoli]